MKTFLPSVDEWGTAREHGGCATRYPLLLVHGVGVRDTKRSRIWGRIPQALRAQGARVYLGGHDGWGTPVNNAAQLHRRVEAILAESGASRVNVIAHSKGGVDVRYLIARYEETLQQGSVVPIASLTTVATPHKGSRTLEVLLYRFRPVFLLLAVGINGFFRTLGDENPNFIDTCEHLQASRMQAYNTTQPALPVYSQQFAGCMHSYRDGIFNVLSYELIRRIDGPNDGLVTLESAAFDNFCGELTTAAGKGITHAGLVDVLKRPFTPKRHRQRRESAQGQTQVQRRESTQSQTQAGQQGEELAQAHEQSQAQAQSQTQSQTQGAQQIPLQVDDILDFYVALVANLKAWGY